MANPEGEGPEPRQGRGAERLRQIEQLSAQGLTMQEIGRVLGISKQRVHQILQGRKALRVRCRGCDREVNPAAARPGDDRAVFCPACLADTPDVSFGEYLKAFRLAVGMSQRDLAARAGLALASLAQYEQGQRMSPPWPVVIRLWRALGVSLVMAPTTGGRKDENS